jgi:RNA polymerase sigma factor (TIGR02999 family)
LPALAARVILDRMSEVTRILVAIEEGDPRAAAQLLPLVYDELRRLAAAHMAGEDPGHTLEATALVHEAYLRLVGGPPRTPGESAPAFHGRRHFFAAAAEAMRRILVDHARKKHAAKRGGDGLRFDLSAADRAYLPDPDTLLSLNEALATLAAEDPASAELARLRLFAGLTVEEAAETLGLSRATAFRDWSYARAWLASALSGEKKSRNP